MLKKLPLAVAVACVGFSAAASPRFNRWQVAGPILQSELDSADASSFIAGTSNSVNGLEAKDYLNPRDPEADGLFFLEYFDNVPAAPAVAFAGLEVEAEEPCSYLMKMNTDHDAELYLNGELLCAVAEETYNKQFVADLRRGRNRFVVKSPRSSGFWAVVPTVLDGPFDADGRREAVRRIEITEHVADMSYLMPYIGDSFVGVTGSRPQITWDKPEAAARVFGDNPVNVTWFDYRMEPTEDFSSRGLYYALIEADLSDGHPYKALFSYYLLPPDWRDDPEVVACFEEFKRCNIKTDWPRYSAPERLHQYLDEGVREVNRNRTPGFSPFVAEWRQRQVPVELVKLAPPEEVDEPAIVLRFGTEEEAGFKPGSVEKFAEHCRNWYRESNGNSFYCIIARNGVIVYAEGFGEVNGEKIKINTPCGLASMSKLLTGVMFARFLDQKLISMDENMARFMPILKSADGFTLTPRRCFNHTGGFNGHSNFGGERNVMGDYEVAYWLPAARPGTICEYNGVGSNLIGMYLMNATAIPIDKLFEHNYFRYLDITSITGDDQGGGYNASAMDLAKIAQLLLNKGSYGKWRFFSPETYNEIMPRDLAADTPGLNILSNWFFGCYGAGIHPFRPDENVEYFGHGSATFTLCLFDPVRQTMIVQARNENASPEVNDRYRDKLEQLVWNAAVADE